MLNQAMHRPLMIEMTIGPSSTTVSSANPQERAVHRQLKYSKGNRTTERRRFTLMLGDASSEWLFAIASITDRTRLQHIRS